MSIEQALAALTAAVEANTAALGGAKTAAPAASKPAAEKSTAKTYEPKHAKEEMQAALAEVKEKAGTPAAKEIITEIGKATKMAEITDPKLIDACYAAAKAKLAEAEDAM
jgi:hypothetical protein